MPTSASILESIANIVAEWRWLAITWHVAALIAGVVLFRRPWPRQRTAAIVIVAPLLSVSAMAWWSGNPFNGTVFAAMATALLLETEGFADHHAVAGSRGGVVAGAMLMAFGLAYPHFLDAESWWTYLYAAPFGLIPCPTIAVLTGASLMFGVFGSRAWALTSGVVALAYGAIGMFVLGVTIDVALIAGAVCLFAAAMRARPTTVRAYDAAVIEA